MEQKKRKKKNDVDLFFLFAMAALVVLAVKRFKPGGKKTISEQSVLDAAEINGLPLGVNADGDLTIYEKG